MGSLNNFVIEPLKKVGNVKLFHHSWNAKMLNNPRAMEEEAVDPACIENFLPTSIGGVDLEEECENDVPWTRLEEMYRGLYSADSHLGRTSSRNILKSLESLERVWDMYAMSNVEEDDLIVVTRADLIFERDLNVRSIATDSLNVPQFHEWKGINDRFAAGSPLVMRAYCKRLQFYLQQLSNPELRNPESVLLAWMNQNNIAINRLDLPFKRVRADGRICGRDLSVGE